MNRPNDAPHSDGQYTHTNHDRGRNNLAASTFTTTLADHPHVTVSRHKGDAGRRALHVGMYEQHNVTMYLADSALATLMLTIGEHFRAIGQLSSTTLEALATVLDAAAAAGVDVDEVEPGKVCGALVDDGVDPFGVQVMGADYCDDLVEDCGHTDDERRAARAARAAR